MKTRSGRSLRLGAKDVLIEELECTSQGAHVVDIVSSKQGSPAPNLRLDDVHPHEVQVAAQVHHPADASSSSPIPVTAQNVARALKDPYNRDSGGGHPRPPLQTAPPTESITNSSLGGVSCVQLSQSSYIPLETGSRDNLVTEQL